MVFGYLFKQLWEKQFDIYNTRTNRMILIATYLIFVYAVSHLNIPYNLFIDFIIDHIRHFLGILMIVAVSKVIKANDYILYIGSNTLTYFCIHNKAVTLFEYLFERVFKNLYALIITSDILKVLYCLIGTIMISLVLLIPTYFINKYLPWSIGKSNK